MWMGLSHTMGYFFMTYTYDPGPGIILSCDDENLSNIGDISPTGSGGSDMKIEVEDELDMIDRIVADRIEAGESKR